jgi:hypothetical protein
VPGDFDGDGKFDPAVIRSTGGAWIWYVKRSTTGALFGLTFGTIGDQPIPTYLIR